MRQLKQEKRRANRNVDESGKSPRCCRFHRYGRFNEDQVKRYAEMSEMLLANGASPDIHKHERFEEMFNTMARGKSC